ncbi:hypothetical protein BLOT_009236 [Blomia tropicalis]|nr:hypothetical protein BLOT_009236 [Blomia tropicalis]
MQSKNCIYIELAYRTKFMNEMDQIGIMDNFSEILFSSLMFFIVEDQDQANRGDTRMVCDGNGNDDIF